tara:strand:+ start:1560 stop:2570 length:1011 start_codon:yes stop_codon:yes gene_type:complete
MGGLCTTNVEVLPDPKEVLTDTEIPEWVSEGGQKLFQQAAELAESEFPAFEGQRIATFEDIDDPDAISKLTGREQRGLQLLEEQSDVYQPYIQRAGEVAADIGAQRLGARDFNFDAFGQSDVDRFAPIFQSAVSPSLADVSETFAREKRDLDLQAGKTGAFGDRSGIEQAELTRGEARERGRLLSEAGRQGLEFAASQYERDRQAAERAFQLTGEERKSAFDLDQASRRMELEAVQSLAPQVQGLVQQEAQGLIGAGEAERLLDQQALEIAYRDYVEQREYPFTSLNFAIGALKGLPFETREFTMQRGGEFIQTPSVYGQTMGGLGALASAYKLLS